MNRLMIPFRRLFSTSAVRHIPKYGDLQPYRQRFRNTEEAVEEFGKNRERGQFDVVLSTDDSKRAFDRDKKKLKRWRRREEFRKTLEAEAGTDEVSEKFDRQPPPVSRSELGADLLDDIQWKRKIMESDMARRKYYNYPVEDNLLTWKAKEQIFQLKQADPETWTPERLSESFPISVEAVRRLLKSKWPPAPTGEDEEDVIRRHDDDVRRRWVLLKRGKTADGLVSELTLNMIRSGEVKFLPMFAAGNSKFNDDNPKKEEFTSVIAPDDGPFVRLYKNHLQFLEKTSAPMSSVEPTSPYNAGRSLVATKDGENVLHPFVFPDDEPGKDDVFMQFDKFRHQLDSALKRRNLPEDRKYRDWMKNNDPQRKRKN